MQLISLILEISTTAVNNSVGQWNGLILWDYLQQLLIYQKNSEINSTKVYSFIHFAFNYVALLLGIIDKLIL